jgi:hypothetical protein
MWSTSKPEEFFVVAPSNADTQRPPESVRQLTGFVDSAARTSLRASQPFESASIQWRKEVRLYEELKASLATVICDKSEEAETFEV